MCSICVYVRGGGVCVSMCEFVCKCVYVCVMKMEKENVL